MEMAAVSRYRSRCGIAMQRAREESPREEDPFYTSYIPFSLHPPPLARDQTHRALSALCPEN